ncbi:MAG: YjjW family glycine radical enzyme activase [Pelolinea sp.]|nr:YjjW family glycine radical enzyme activase [Pelolinea sp.]
MISGKINKILTSSFVDGPGNRAVIFLQGCNFNCLYCHNPYTINECIHCGVCVEQCPADALEMVDDKVHWIMDLCTECDTCIKVCPYSSSPKVRAMTSEEIWQGIDSAVPFLSGVSVSGGEPLLQIPFLVEFFDLIHDRSNLTTYIETNGYVKKEDMLNILPHVDLVQVDLKCMDDELHKTLTGKSVDAVMESIRLVHEKGKLYSVQQVIVNDFTANEKLIGSTADFLVSVDPSIRLRLVKFRPHGTIGAAASWQSPSDEMMVDLQKTALARGLKIVSISIEESDI